MKVVHEATYHKDYFVIYPIITLHLAMWLIFFADNKPIIIGLVFILSFIIATIYAIKLYKIFSTYKWIKIKATMRDIYIKSITVQDRWMKETQNHVVIEYEFLAQNKTYKSSRFSIVKNDISLFNKEEELESIKNKINNFVLKNSHNFFIYCNPKNPHQSIVRKGASKDVYTEYGAIFCMSFFSFIGFFIL